MIGAGCWFGLIMVDGLDASSFVAGSYRAPSDAIFY